jgi:hypothetical protein
MSKQSRSLHVADSAVGPEEEDDVVARSKAGDTGADIANDSGTFVSQNERQLGHGGPVALVSEMDDRKSGSGETTGQSAWPINRHRCPSAAPNNHLHVVEVRVADSSGRNLRGCSKKAR